MESGYFPRCNSDIGNLGHWKRGIGIDECFGSRLISLPCFFVFPSVSGPNLFEKLFELLRKVEVCSSRAGSR